MTRDVFGRLLIDPSQLDLPARVDVLRHLGGALQASESLEERWLGRVLVRWLQNGGDLVDQLGVKAQRGSRRTPQRLVRQDEIDRKLLQFSDAVGGPRRASRVLCGELDCPSWCVDLRAELQALAAPASPHAFQRAKRRAARHGA